MRDRHDEMKPFRAIDDLASSSPKRLFAMSPNDALVQVALPLVLILAIITRLLVVGQSISNYSRGPVILEMWKQQLILRLDNVMQDWEQSAQLAAFPDAERIQWGETLPQDDRFQALCQTSLALNRSDQLATTLYHRALQFDPSNTDTNAPAAGVSLQLYDPLAPFAPEDADRIPPEFIINQERRTYAMSYVREQIAEWQQQVEILQWSAVATAAARLPLDEQSESKASSQMQTVAAALESEGYPLLDSLLNEYRAEAAE